MIFNVVSEKSLNINHINPFGNDFQISPTILIKFGEKFLLIYTKLLKITKKNFLEFSYDIFKL